MKTTNTQLFLFTVLLTLAALTFPAYGAGEESFVLDPSTGNYTITYYGDDGTLQRVVWIPATKIIPTVTSHFARRDNLTVYRYRVTNGANSKQNVASAGITLSTMQAGSQRMPDGWNGAVSPNVNKGTGYNVGWWENSDDLLGGIKPRHSVAGFGVDSPDLPGVGEMQLDGATPPDQSFPDEGPDSSSPVGQQFYAVYDHDYVSRHVATPLIAIPTPFAITPVLTSLQRHVDEDLVGMKLIDPTLVARLDSLFQSAIAAAQGGNNTALRSHLRALRAALNNEREQEERSENVERQGEIEDAGEKPEVGRNQPIAKIARDVLEFDLEYLERWVKPAEDRRNTER
jgi:hypothetical protein